MEVSYSLRRGMIKIRRWGRRICLCLLRLDPKSFRILGDRVWGASTWSWRCLCGQRLYPRDRIPRIRLQRLTSSVLQRGIYIMIWLIGQKLRMKECWIRGLRLVGTFISRLFTRSRLIRTMNTLYKTCLQSSDLGTKILCKSILTSWMKTCIQETSCTHRYITWIGWLTMLWQSAWRTQESLSSWWGCLSS